MELLSKISRQSCFRCFNYVPSHLPITAKDVEQLSSFINHSEKVLILTGAGVSTESGIPDYRSEGVGLYSLKRGKPYNPIQHNEFLKDSNVRKRYWFRNYIGWPSFSIKEPNITHLSLTKLERKKKVVCIITQNVDNLHFKAESKNVIELHGSAFRIKCLGCERLIEREQFQDILKIHNSDISFETFNPSPDGDVDIDESLVNYFYVPDCFNCGGIFQPDIVFFGSNIPRNRHDLVKKNVDECDSLLVLGTSLSVFSSYRILLRAHEKNKPIAIVNIGKTRGDHLAFLKINARCGEIIPHIL